MSRHFLKITTRTILVALAYFFTGWLGLMLPAFGSHITLLWLPTGIAVGCLLRWGHGLWPGVALGAFAVNLATGASWPVASCISAGNTLGPLLAAWALRRMGLHAAFDRKRDILLLAAGGVLGMVVSAGLGVSTLWLAGLLADGRIAAWLTWWAGDATGVIAAAPLVLACTRKEWRSILLRRAEFLTWAFVTIVTTWGVFVLNRGLNGQPWALAFLPLPMVAWAALRFGSTGTSIALIVLSAGAAYGTATGRGPFYRPDPIEGVVVQWTFMATSAVLGWLITALHFERIRATEIRTVFEQALSDSALGILLAGRDRRITYANAGFTRLTGYAEEEVRGKSCALLQGPGTDPAMAELLKTAILQHRYFDGEILNYRKDGTLFWNALLVSPVRDESGVTTGFFGIQRDITPRKEAEMALQQSEEHLRTIVALAPECVKLISKDGTLLEMNPAGLAMIEAGSLAEVQGQPLASIIVPEDRAGYAAMHQRVLDGEMGRCEFTITGLKGTRRTLATHAVPYRDAHGEIVGALGMTRDITQQKEAAADLQETFSTLQLFINSVPAYISFVDADERYRLVNRNYEQYFGLPADRIEGRRLRDIQTPEAYAEMEPHIRKALAGGPVRYQSNPTGPGGDSRWFDVQYVPRRRGDGAVSGFFALVFDITETKRSEIALHDSRSRLDSILNSMEDVVWSCTPDGKALNFVSASVKAMYGRPASEFMADPTKWLGMVHPEDREAVERAFCKITESGEMDLEHRIIRSDGATRWVQDRARLVQGTDGQPLRLDGIVTDITERRIAEERLRDSEERLRLALSGTEQGLYDLNVQTGACTVSPEYARMLGYDPAEFVETNAAWRERLHPDERDAVYAECADYIAGRRDEYSVEFRQRTKGGGWKWILSQGSLVSWSPDRRPLRMLGTHTDITHRKLAEEALRESEDRFRKLIEHAPEAIQLLDIASGRFVQISAASERLFKRSVAELLQIGPMELSPPMQPDGRPSREKGKEFLERAMAGEKPVFEWTHRDSEGRDIPCEVRLLRMEIGGRAVVRGSVTDITERKAAEGRVKESEARYRTLFEANPHPMWAYDLETLRFLAVNAAAATHYGYSQEEFLAMTIRDIRPPEDVQALLANIAATGPEPAHAGVWRHRRRDGSLIEVEISSHEIEFDGRRARVVLANDVTEQRRAKIEREHLDRKLQETQKLESLGVLAGGIAHDFNNILTAILGNASLAVNEVHPGSPVHECLDQISQAALRAADLCKQMLAYSGRGRFVVRRLDLGQLIADTIQMLHISISKKATLRFRPGTDLPPVEVDATQMRQVIMNLVINASEALGENGGTIEVSTGLIHVDRAYLDAARITPELPEADYVFLEVSDNGCGMNAETQARIFDPFYTTKFTGRGLGLAAVLGIVRGHKGAMKVHSEVGRGSTFKVLFPAAPGPSEGPAATPAVAADWRGEGTVLVVDDEPSVRTTVAQMLAVMGLQCEFAVDGREGVEIFRRAPTRFALVLLDLTMPHMDGAETFAELRKMRAGVPVILMSGFNEQEALVRFAGKGIASFIQKPFALDSLRTVIRGVLG